MNTSRHHSPKMTSLRKRYHGATERMHTDAFSRAYMVAALWSSVDDDGEPLDKDRDVDDIDRATFGRMIRDCRAFQKKARADLRGNSDEYAHLKDRNDLRAISDEKAGHDFWLTRNGHGVGFWDRGLGARGDRLSKIAETFGGFDLYVGDDGKIHGS